MTKTPRPELAALLEELRALGATVVTGPALATPAEIAAAEEELGFAFPAAYRAFLAEVGGIAITSGRTWFFYGLPDALARTRAYAAEVGAAPVPPRPPGSRPGPYMPRRFVVLADEGAFADPAWGTVYDADLDAMIATSGRHWLSRDDALALVHDTWLLEELIEVRDRITDEQDVRASGT